jgi:hypothetical protein
MAAAISAIRASAMDPGPEGIADTNPSASAPALIAAVASWTEAMQQTFIRVRIDFPLLALDITEASEACGFEAARPTGQQRNYFEARDVKPFACLTFPHHSAR